MGSVLSNPLFWYLAGPFAVGIFVEMFFTYSQPLIERRPNALLWNNLFLLGLLALLVAVFIKVGFLGGILAIVLGAVAVGIGARIAVRAMFQKIKVGFRDQESSDE